MRDGAAIGVDPPQVGLKLGLPGQHDAGECFIDLDHTDIIQPKPGPIEHGARGGDWAIQHEHRIRSDDCPGGDARQRLQVVLAQGRVRCDEQRRSAIADLAAVPRRHDPVRFKDRFQLPHLRPIGLKSDALVVFDQRPQAVLHHVDRGNLGRACDPR